MHVGTPALIVILTLQSATVTLSKSSTKASIMIQRLHWVHHLQQHLRLYHAQHLLKSV